MSRTKATRHRETSPDEGSLELADAGALGVPAVLLRLRTSDRGLDAPEARHRLEVVGPNAIVSHGARPWAVLARQLRNPLLLLLVTAALVSVVVGQEIDAGIILGISGLSIGLGFVNEYRSEHAIEELHSSVRHRAVVIRLGRTIDVDVVELVPGDVTRLEVGDVVPADVRIIASNGLECDEAVLTGESMPAPKRTDPVVDASSPTDLPSCAFMGTVVRAGSGVGVVVRTGATTAFGRIARRLGDRPAETAFQLGLRDFSHLLVRVTTALTLSIFMINVLLHRPLLDAALFSLAIAVGLTPQLLPAIVTISLSTGARRLARSSVVVKRLVSIEDLGNIEILFTDKTGTLTEGRIEFTAAVDAAGKPSDDPLLFGLLCNAAVANAGIAVGGNPLDQALWRGGEEHLGTVSTYERIAEAPFDYDRRCMSVLVESADVGRIMITKGAPETILARCPGAGDVPSRTVEGLFDSGARVVAVATKSGRTLSSVSSSDEHGLELVGFLTFADPPKAGADDALDRLRALGIGVKVVTGDNERVARKVCSGLGMDVGGTLDGGDLEHLDDRQLAAALPGTTIFARVAPEQKSRIIRVQRSLGVDVAFLGDGVNDAVALHDADVGISVDTASDVAKDAADIVLMKKDLGVLADGVIEGRRIFANTIKYVLMGTSSNFGNMFSAAGASIFLRFLPMLPTQILLNNLLYDVSEMTIPTDTVDAELLQRPSHWDTSLIRRFMAFFGPISSLYDFMTFAVMIWIFHAGERSFHTGWFVESLTTQSLVIFVIRTRRVPFLRSRPSLPLLVTTLTCAGIGVALPFTPAADVLGFTPLPLAFLGILALMSVTYLALVEAGKQRFFRTEAGRQPIATRRSSHQRRIHRLAVRWSHRSRTTVGTGN
jgi:P-type Mg2+ transporter